MSLRFLSDVFISGRGVTPSLSSVSSQLTSVSSANIYTPGVVLIGNSKETIESILTDEKLYVDGNFKIGGNLNVDGGLFAVNTLNSTTSSFLISTDTDEASLKA